MTNQELNTMLSNHSINGYSADTFCNAKSIQQLREEVEYKKKVCRQLYSSMICRRGPTANRERRVKELEQEIELIEIYLNYHESNRNH